MTGADTKTLSRRTNDRRQEPRGISRSSDGLARPSVLPSPQKTGSDRTLPPTGYLVLERSRAERPDGGEHEVRFVHVPRRVCRAIVGRYQTLEQRAQHLDVRDLRHGCDDLKLAAERLQARRHVFLEQHHQRGLFGRVVSSVDPAGRVRVPAQVGRVDVQDTGPGYGGRRGRPQVRDLEQQPHGRRQRDPLVAGQRQHLDRGKGVSSV